MEVVGKRNVDNYARRKKHVTMTIFTIIITFN
jgi:hypothetical protein